jgi:hypothetical protein
VIAAEALSGFWRTVAQDAPAFPLLHRIAHEPGGARFNRSELAVEAADALERIASLAAELEAIKSTPNAKENA